MGGELGGEGVPVAADEGVAPFDEAALGVTEPVDRERRDVVRAATLGAFGGGGDDGVDVFATAVEPDAGAGGEFRIEAGVGEVGLQ